MREPDDDLTRRLRELADQLDQASIAVDPVAARSRSDGERSLRAATVGRDRFTGGRLALVAAAVAVLLGAVVAIRAAQDPSDHVEAAAPSVDTTESMQPVVSTTTPTPNTTTIPLPPRWSGTAWTDLPAGGLASLDLSGRLRLYALDGTELGTAEASGLDAVELGNRGTAVTIGVQPGPSFALVGADPAEAPDGCQGASGGGGVRVALCTSGDQAQIVRLSPTGERSVVSGPLPPDQGGGHWAGAIVSPDGRWVLAQWSGECEVPSAWLIPITGGGARRVTGAAADGTSPNSSAVGWDSDGRALVAIDGPEPACGSGTPEPGTYAVDPATLDRDLVVPADGDLFAAATWRREEPGNRPEQVVARALDELGLEGCCGEPSHGGQAATSGAVVNGRDIAISMAPSAWFERFPRDAPVTGPTSIRLTGDASGVIATNADGPFLAFTCGGDTWRLAGQGSPVDHDQLRDLANRLIPHAYCTMGEAPDVG